MPGLKAKVFWLVAFLLMVFAGSEPLFACYLPAAQDTTAEADSSRLPDPTGAMIRSILFPGWGQWYNGKRWKAALVFVVEAGIVANALYWDRKMKEATTSRERAWAQENRNVSFWYLGLAILISMGDAYIDAHLAGFDVSPDLSGLPGTVFSAGVRARF